jgi:hypothetical protein
MIRFQEAFMKAILRAGVVLAVLLLGVPAALAQQPAMHFTEDVSGDVFACGETTYTVVSGTLRVVIHEGESASGNGNFTGTLTPQNVVLEDEAGNTYFIAGAVWFGGVFIAQQGTEAGWFTTVLPIITPVGGTVDSVNMSGHFTNGNEFSLDIGTCVPPED